MQPKLAQEPAYDLPDMPDAGNLKMKYKNSYLTYNAIRTIKANADAEGTLGDKENSIEAWKNTNWEKERIWMLDNAGGNSTWKVEKSAIYRTVTITDAEKKSLETVLDAVGGKKARDSKYKQMNLTTIRTSPVYVLTKNYLVADGKGPITVTPVQMLSTEIDNTSLYYYYFDPKKLEGKSEEEQVIFLKNLPKFKCVDSKLTKTASGLGKGNGEYFKAHEYLLPYFGDVSSDETGDVTAQGFIFPEGTRIGFMLRKTTTDWSDSFSADNDINKGTGYTKKSYNKAVNGEVYADGRLNKQINHYPDFMNALDKGMLDDDPRVAIFG